MGCAKEEDSSRGFPDIVEEFVLNFSNDECLSLN